MLGHLLGSDHLPLQIVLSLSTRPAPSSSASQQQQATLQQIIPSKDRETVQRYIAAMADPATFDELRQLTDSDEASAETLNAAFTPTDSDQYCDWSWLQDARCGSATNTSAARPCLPLFPGLSFA
jgi:hypothetical protein